MNVVTDLTAHKRTGSGLLGRVLCCALTLLLAHSLASAAPPVDETGDPAPQEISPVSEETQELYRQALQSIAEGRKDDASATLSRVIKQEPQHAGAWLDLALIQCSLGHGDEANRLFAIIEVQFNPPPGIVELISEARANGCERWAPQSQTTFSFSRGIDQNVNQGSSQDTFDALLGGVHTELPLLPDFLPQHDQYSAMTVDYMRDLTANGTVGIVQFQGRRYDHLNQYSTASLVGSIETPWRFGQWTIRGSLTAGMVTLGSQYYQQFNSVQARVGVPLPLPPSLNFSVTAAVSRINFRTLSNFDSVTKDVRGILTYRSDRQSAQLYLGYLDDHALASRPGGDRGGWLAGATWRRRLWGDWSGELAVNHQGWRSTTAYSPGFIDTVRSQRNDTLRAVLSYPLGRDHSLMLEGRAIRNRENISLFQYNDRLLQLSWQWRLP